MTSKKNNADFNIEEQESLDQWVQILAAQRFVLGHGYHIVKNNPDVAVDHAVARTQERDFFASTPWSTVLSTYQSRFGTSQLQVFLSQILTAEIRTRSVTFFSCKPYLVIIDDQLLVQFTTHRSPGSR